VITANGDQGHAQLRSTLEENIGRIRLLHEEADRQRERFEHWFTGWRGWTPWGWWIASRTIKHRERILEECARILDESCALIAEMENVTGDAGERE
jgi:hypothetical protein